MNNSKQAMSLDSNAERELFEAWAATELYSLRIEQAIDGEVQQGAYTDELTRAAWDAWLARSQPSEWVAKVPVEAIKVAINSLEYVRDNIMGGVNSNHWQIPETVDAIHALKALLPPNTEAKS